MKRSIALCWLLCLGCSPNPREGDKPPQDKPNAQEPASAEQAGAGGLAGAPGTAGGGGTRTTTQPPNEPTAAGAGGTGDAADEPTSAGGAPEPLPSSCTVEDNDDGSKTIACSDGTSVTVSDGAPGEQGEQGEPGAPGASGQPGADALSAYQSGDRIKVQWLVGDDGSRTFAGFYDSELDHQCAWLLASDDAVRCLPTWGRDVSNWSGYFADADCLLALGLVPVESSTALRYVTAVSYDTYRIFEVTGEYAGRSGIHQQGVTGTCMDVNEANTAALLATYSLWLVGDEIPPTDFVAARLMTDGS